MLALSDFAEASRGVGTIAKGDRVEFLVGDDTMTGVVEATYEVVGSRKYEVVVRVGRVRYNVDANEITATDAGLGGDIC